MQFNAVVETNHNAVSLWQSLGFTVLTTIPGAFRHPVHGFVGLHVMYRSLAARRPSSRRGTSVAHCSPRGRRVNA